MNNNKKCRKLSEKDLCKVFMSSQTGQGRGELAVHRIKVFEDTYLVDPHAAVCIGLGEGGGLFRQAYREVRKGRSVWYEQADSVRLEELSRHWLDVTSRNLDVVKTIEVPNYSQGPLN